MVWLWIVGSREVHGTVFGSADQHFEGALVGRWLFTGLLVLGAIVLVRRGPQVGRLLRANVPTSSLRSAGIRT